jgi:DNA-binding NtrC family response regulator
VLFLDEIDALPPPAQGKLLRFLQERTFKPLGSESVQHVDVRVLAATNRDIEALVRTQRFRADLFFRLNVLPIQMIPLRDRAPDIPVLAAHFLDAAARADGGPARRLTAGAQAKLASHAWPGNVRELENVIQRTVAMAEGEWIDADDLPFTPAGGRAAVAAGSFREARARVVASFERSFVEELLRKHDGNVSAAAREAKKDRRAFGRLAKKHGLDRTAR